MIKGAYMLSKITLGTAQLGLNYGISNISGRPDFNEAIDIIRLALGNSIFSFDTAQVYGDSEKVLGEIFSNLNFVDFFVSTKIPSLSKQSLPKKDIRDFVLKSFDISSSNLKMTKINNFMLHDFKDIVEYEHEIFESINYLKENSFIDFFGISIYDVYELEYIFDLNKRFPNFINSIQFPANLFDRRFLNLNIQKKLKQQKIMTFCRSAFLQGLFFLDISKKSSLPKYIEFQIQKLNSISNDWNISKLVLALSFLKKFSFIDSFVVGVERSEQLAQIIEAFHFDLDEFKFDFLFSEFREINELIYDPRKWTF